MTERRYGLTIEADIHGMTRDEARDALLRLLDRAPKDITEIVVIHGCNGGTTLQGMVRRGLSHPRILQKQISMNNGQTSLILRRL